MADGFNVPSGEGLLAQQQETAAKIPYENIEANQASLKTALGTFLNTFHVASQVNTQRQKLEQALQMAYMKNDLQEREFSQKQSEAEMRHALAVQGLDLRATIAEGSARNASERTEIMRDAFNLKQDNVEKRDHDISGAFNDLADLSNQGEDYKSGGLKRESALYSIFSRYPNIPASNKNAMLSSELRRHKDTIETQTKGIDAEERNLRNRWSLDTYGVQNKGDINALLEPKRWFKPEYKTIGGGSAAVDMEGQPDTMQPGKRIQFEKDKSGNPVEAGKLTLLLQDPTNPDKPLRKTMSVAEVTRYRAELQDIRNRRAHLAPLPHDISAGVSAQTPSESDIRTLQNNPNLATKFDVRFGRGESQKYLY